MGPTRRPRVGSSILSKTTPKTIAKHSLNTSIAEEQDKQAFASRLASKLEVLRRETLERTANIQGSDKSPSGPGKPESTRGRLVTNGQGQATPKAKQDEASAAALKIDNQVLHPEPPPQQASSTDYHKLVRPLVSRPREPAFNPPRAPAAMSSVYGRSKKSNIQHGERDTDEFHGYDEYEVGVIFSFATHEHHYDQSLVDIEGDTSFTRLGVVNSKFRKHIVVRRYPDHVIALPIFTHQGNGLTRKRSKNEYISIRDLDYKDRAAGAETEHGILWAKVDPAYNQESASAWHRMSNVTSVQFTRPQIHMMDRKSTICGKLDPDSRIKLKNLFLKAMEADSDGFESLGAPVKTHPMGQAANAHFPSWISNCSEVVKGPTQGRVPSGIHKPRYID